MQELSKSDLKKKGQDWLKSSGNKECFVTGNGQIFRADSFEHARAHATTSKVAVYKCTSKELLKFTGYDRREEKVKDGIHRYGVKVSYIPLFGEAPKDENPTDEPVVEETTEEVKEVTLEEATEDELIAYIHENKISRKKASTLKKLTKPELIEMIENA